MCKIQIGDMVKVINIGLVYNVYLEWAKAHNLANYKQYCRPSLSEEFRVTAVERHIDFSNLKLAGIVDTHSNEYIVGIQGLEVISRPAGENPVPTQLLWNCKCATCGSDAYTGLIKTECSNPNCKERLGNR